MRAHLRSAAPSLEQRVGVPELHLSRRVIDRVVRVPAQQVVAYINPLAPLANLKAVQRQDAAIGGRVRIEMNAHREDGRWTLRREIIARRAIQRVVALHRGQFRRVGKRRQMWEHDELIAHRIALIGIARARKQPVVLIERRRIVGERQTQPGEIRVTRRRALALIHAQRHREAAAIDLAPADAIRIADLEPKRRRRGGDAGLGIVNEPQRVHLRRVGIRVHRKRADRVEPARGDVGDRQVIALIETVGEREPRPTRVDVVVFPFL